MLNQTQKQFIIKHLREFGFITRNFCLEHYISRLGALILILKKEGWEFEDGAYIDHYGSKDFKYKLIKEPEYTLF